MGKIKGKLEIGNNLEKIILEMKVGEIAYTYPINLEFDHNFNAYLDLLGTALGKKNKKRNCTLYVERISEDKDGYLVNISKVKKYKWERAEFPHGEDIEEINNPRYNLQIANLGKIEIEAKPKSIDEQIEDAIRMEDYKLAEQLQKKKDLN